MEQLEPVCRAIEPVLEGLGVTATEDTCPRALAPQREKPTVRSPCITAREKPTQQQRPRTATDEINTITSEILKKEQLPPPKNPWSDGEVGQRDRRKVVQSNMWDFKIALEMDIVPVCAMYLYIYSHPVGTRMKGRMDGWMEGGMLHRFPAYLLN